MVVPFAGRQPRLAAVRGGIAGYPFHVDVQTVPRMDQLAAVIGLLPVLNGLLVVIVSVWRRLFDFVLSRRLLFGHVFPLETRT